MKKTIVVRNVNENTWRKFKAECALVGTTTGAMLEKILVDWLKTSKK